MNSLELSIKTAHLRAALLFAGVLDVRYYLNGVHFFNLNGMLAIEATDGHRLIRITTDTKLSQHLDAIVPTNAIKDMAKLKASTAQINFASKSCAAESFHTTWQLIEGRFPDCNAVLPKSWKLPALSGYHNPLFIADAWRAVGFVKGLKAGALFNVPLQMVSETYGETSGNYKSGEALYKGKVGADTVEIVIMPMRE